jgi:hypothetical protein
MAISNGDVLKIVASLVYPDDVIMMNVFHVVATTIVGDGAEDDVVLDLAQYAFNIYNELAASVGEDMDDDILKMYVYDSIDEDFDEIGSSLWSLGATQTGELLPHGVALMQTFYTIDPDVQGRKYWGGFTELDQVDGSWASQILANAVLAADEIVGTYVGVETGSTYQPVVWSPTQLNAFLYSGVVISNSIVNYQRRRRPGVGI